ncbi:tripartite tricarboxylate transporter TctB family protein [Halobellus captivus]|uniref:tripartite tricarboxylate transporter TctB family protein n=1 Tax=Halobellus captivus TaxID=2592614 RepID=UPI0011A1041F|nr:tripartite tricarboxylate transporter TctB family protein [Halobellus captivus]
MTITPGSIDPIFERLSSVDSRLWSGIFFGILGLYTLAVVLEARTYSSDARLFPLIVGVPFLGLVVLKLVLMAASGRLSLGSFEVIDLADGMGETAAVDVTPAVRYRREFAMILWIVVLSALLWAFGFLFALLVFLFSFVLLYERKPIRAALVGVGTFSFVYVFFIRLLGANIYEGAYPIAVLGALL